MARNQEKAQSMLYRFREAQATSLGLTPKTTRRPRLASSVSSLKECEKWRGEVLREISRKVSKIQDFGLTDYEVRDLNDEINKLLREKGHWERQIVALGGANYARAVPSMLGGDAGIGGRGYKYFGRAKELPGVKEIFSKTRQQEEVEQSWRTEKYQRFQNQPPAYFGDEDEDDASLLTQEAEREEHEWEERYREIVERLQSDQRQRRAEAGEDDEEDDAVVVVPKIPRPTPRAWRQEMEAFASAYSNPEAQQQLATGSQDQASAAKRQKGSDGNPLPATTTPAVAYSIFTRDDLAPPTIPDRTALEKMILNAKKRQLRQQYIGSS